MIPLRLTVSNFMSYPAGAPPVDFSGLHLACLSGENGHGKSALLDAITWVLWGQARANSDDLVRLGSTLMWVDFEFKVDGVHYRVLRKRTVAGSSSTRTELQAVTEDGTYQSQTGQGERSTQEKINRILRMDYRTFINSAFILQGRTDEFTRQTPTERKKILTEILDLSHYDRLEIQARERQRLADDQVRVLEGEVKSLNQEVERRPEYETNLARAQTQFSQAETSVNEFESMLTDLRTESSRLETSLALVQSLQIQKDAALKQATAARMKITRLNTQLGQIDRLLSQRERVAENVRNLAVVRTRLESMEGAHKEHLNAQERLSDLNRRLSEIRHGIEIELARLEENFKALKKRSEAIAHLDSEIQTLRKGVASSQLLETRMDEMRDLNQRLSDEATAATSGAEFIRQQIDSATKKMDLLKSPSAECPLCNQPLGNNDRQRLTHQLSLDLSDLRNQLTEREKEKKQAEEQRARLKDEGRRVMRDLSESRKVEQEIRDMEAKLATARQADAEIGPLKQEIAELHTKLSGDLCPALTIEAAEIQKAIDTLGYNPTQHDTLRSQVRSLQGAEREQIDLEHAQKEKNTVEQQIAEETDRAKEGDRTAESIQTELTPMAGLKERKVEIDRQMAARQADREHAAVESSQASQNVGKWMSLLGRCQQMEEDIREKERLKTEASSQSAIYGDLAAAFGKKGIQAMIIENAIPELETEANHLLARMSDNGMRIAFHTQRELKKGGDTETLDIIIGDEMGDRPYECYSGGEAFRINFAIRIAISRLLARRAGARLQTIVIDEGFGTQDAQGRKRIIESIQSIRDEFACILVITHLDDLKDEFPIRLHVTKDENGSHVEMMD